MEKIFSVLRSPVGPLTLAGQDGFITHLLFGQQGPAGYAPGETELLRRAAGELEEYFGGRLREFSLPLRPAGTEFQLRVWAALRDIPYGETRSYRDVALAASSPRAYRAVGAANHANPISIIVPCHRVIGSGGGLTGYGGGLEAKGFLLELERKFSRREAIYD